MDRILFDSIEDLVRIAIITPFLFAFVILVIRLSGKRVTSQMNNFDWVVTVAMGSLVGAGIILDDVTISEVVVAVGVLILLQHLLTRAVVRSSRISKIVKATPRLLLYDGQIIEEAMLAERVSRQELMAVIRQNGIARLEDTGAVVLETDATMSVLPMLPDKNETPTSFSSVSGWPDDKG